jgi:hypothetical protein
VSRRVSEADRMRAAREAFELAQYEGITVLEARQLLADRRRVALAAERRARMDAARGVIRRCGTADRASEPTTGLEPSHPAAAQPERRFWWEDRD